MIDKLKVTYGNMKKTESGNELFDIKFIESSLNCPTHGIVKYSKIWSENLPEMDTCPDCEKDIQSQNRAAEKKLSDQRNRIAIYDNANIPERFRSKTFDSYVDDTEPTKRNKSICLQYAKSFHDSVLVSGTCIIMSGTLGTGKTHLACAIANYLLFDDYNTNVLFCSISKIIRSIKDSWNTSTKESEVLQNYTNPDLLIIDEIGVQFGSDTERNYLFDILNDRYENVLPTIIISNLVKTELINFIGERVIDRLHEGGGFTLDFSGDSKRV